jgi:hypothetical protein
MDYWASFGGLFVFISVAAQVSFSCCCMSFAHNVVHIHVCLAGLHKFFWSKAHHVLVFWVMTAG